jgi:pyruvate ferredoxin oxidoreductase alpha subunit
VNIDGFILSHSLEGVEITEDEEVKNFVSTRASELKVDPDKPVTIGAMCLTDYYFETKRQQVEALKESKKVIDKVNEEYEALTGRRYGPIDTYGLEDADAAILCLGSTAGTAKTVAKNLRGQGKKVGVIKPWVYRPFPAEELVKATQNLKALAILDRACSLGAPYAALCSDAITALYQNRGELNVFNVIYGLGGRDMTSSNIEAIFNESLEVAESGLVKKSLVYMGVRE